MRCQGCGKFGYFPLCIKCQEVKDAVEERKGKLESSFPYLYIKDPVDIFSPEVADRFRVARRRKQYK